MLKHNLRDCFPCFMKWLNRPGWGNHTTAWTRDPA
jgi:hypothetical protein